MRKIVLLPEPLGPSRPTISPGAMANETSVTARRGPYDFVTCCASTTGDIKTHKTQMPETSARHTRPNTIPGAKPGIPIPSHIGAVAQSLVKFGRVLVRFERVRVVRIDDVAAFDVADALHPGVRVEHADGIVDTADARQNVLVEILLEIDGVAGEHDRAGLRQTHHHDLASRGVRHCSMDVDAVVAEQIEIAVKFDGLVLAGHAAADAVAQHGEVVGDEERRISWRRPERVLDLVALEYERRVEELADIAGVIDMEVSEHDIFDVGGLDVDLAQLRVDGDIRRAARIKRLHERSPVVGIGDDLVVVAAIEQHVPLRMPNEEEADRNLNLAATAVLND